MQADTIVMRSSVEDQRISPIVSSVWGLLGLVVL